jgi:ABC-type dipeptide/oligopeptide/nickel transport system permease component
MTRESLFVRIVLTISGIAFWLIAAFTLVVALIVSQDYGINDGSPGLENILWGEVAKFVIPSAILGTLNIALVVREFRASKVLK